MRSEQWEAIHVLLNLLQGNLPSPYRVALLAVRSKLALMYVRMAVSALLSDVGKHRFGVALGASHSLMHAAKGISGLIVIKFRKAPNRLPRTECVAVLAGNVKVSVGAASRGVGLLLRLIKSGSSGQQQHRSHQVE
jgi:hypothetical protein